MEQSENIKKSYKNYLHNTHDIHDAESIIEGFKTDRDKDAFDEVAKDFWNDCDRDSFTIGAEFGKFQREAQILLNKTNRRKQLFLKKTLQVVASVAAFVCLVFVTHFYYEKYTLSNIQYNIVATTYSEHKKVVLPDGSIVTLNSCSKLRYPSKFSGEERQIELEGEGHFDVAGNESKPFLVKMEDFSVKVLGTVFDVKSYLNDEVLAVEVESGKVQVNLPEAMMRLTANERMTINKKSGEFIKNTVEQTKFAPWRFGELHFINAPISDVAKELERCYGCKITFKEGQDFTNRISGLHENSILIDVLNNIEFVTNIHYKIDGNQVLLFKY